MNLPAFSASFLSAGIEFFETAAIAYAIARAGFPREAVSGTAAGLTAVFGISVLSWRSLQRIPLHFFQGCVGVMLAAVGASWIVKSIRRKQRHQRARWISDPLREDKFELQTNRFSVLNLALMAKSAAIEGLAVAIILVSIGVASRAWVEVTAAGFAALAVTITAVMLLHGRLRRIPESSIQLCTGAVLFVLGAFWLLESLSQRAR